MTQPNEESTQADATPADDANGLSSAEAARRLKEFGPNAVAAVREPSAPRFPRTVLGAGALDARGGDRGPDRARRRRRSGGDRRAARLQRGAWPLSSEGRAQAALDAPEVEARAHRLGEARRRLDAACPAAELVPGDVVKLSLGAVVPADVQLMSGAVLLDQSMLTGESVPLEAAAGRQDLCRRAGSPWRSGRRGHGDRAKDLIRPNRRAGAHRSRRKRAAEGGARASCATWHCERRGARCMAIYARRLGMPPATSFP